MKLAVIGCGKMGSALVGGMVKSGAFSPANLVGFDAYQPSAEALSKASGIGLATSSEQALADAEGMLICVKPADIAPLGAALRGLSGGSRLVISIAAGVTLASLQEAFGSEHRIVRVMPNTPALVGVGVAGIAPGEKVGEDDLAVVEKIFSSVGTAMQVPEKLIDAVTGVSGSGPAYVYTFIEALADGGVLMGLPRDKAIESAAQTVMGAAKMVLETGLHPAQLRDQVTSPGGTTIAGLEVLEEEGIRSAVMGAVRAATERAEELGKA